PFRFDPVVEPVREHQSRVLGNCRLSRSSDRQIFRADPAWPGVVCRRSRRRGPASRSTGERRLSVENFLEASGAPARRRHRAPHFLSPRGGGQSVFAREVHSRTARILAKMHTHKNFRTANFPKLRKTRPENRAKLPMNPTHPSTNAANPTPNKRKRFA